MPSHLSEFDEYAQNYMQELDHPIRRLVAPQGGSYFVQIKCQELHFLIEEASLDSRTLDVLDVGAGIGLFEKILQPSVKRLVAMDLSREMLKVASQLNPLNSGGGYFCSDALCLPVKDESFDLVFCSCLFHHMPHEMIAPAIAEMRRVCKPGGRVVVFEHNPYNPLTQLIVRTTPLDKNAKLMSSATLLEAFQQAGFSSTTQRFILYGPSFIDRQLQRFRRFLYRIPLGGQFYVVGEK